MHEIIINSELDQQLGQVNGAAILCDSNGRALGFFSPIPGKPFVNNLRLESPLSITETELLRKDKSGKSLEEILTRLGL